MQPRELAARRFQLDRRSVSREISNVSPIDHFDSPTAAQKWRRQPSPQSNQAHIRAGYAPFICRFDDLHIVDAHYAFAIDVDQLLVEHVASEQHFPIASREGSQIENI